MGEIRECERGDELDGRVVAIFDSVVSAGSDKSEAAFLAAALCAAVYGADTTVVGGSSSLSAEVIPDRSDADFEPALRTILGRMRSLGNALDLSVEAGGVAFSGMKESHPCQRGIGKYAAPGPNIMSPKGLMMPPEGRPRGNSGNSSALGPLAASCLALGRHIFQCLSGSAQGCNINPVYILEIIIIS